MTLMEKVILGAVVVLLSVGVFIDVKADNVRIKAGYIVLNQDTGKVMLCELDYVNKDSPKGNKYPMTCSFLPHPSEINFYQCIAINDPIQPELVCNKNSI